MKKFPIAILLLLSFLLIGCYTASATVTQTTPSPTEGTTGVHVTKDFTIQLNATNGTMVYNMSLYKSATLIQYTTATAQTNGSKTFTLNTMDGNTLYQVRVNVNDSDGFTNATYNFTTSTKPLTLDTTNFSSAEIVVIALITIAIIIGFVVSTMNDIKEHKKLDVNLFLKKMVTVIFFVVIIVIIGSLI